MYLLVYKFGGSSVADAAGLRCAAGQLAAAAAAGFHIIAVVSAQGKTTDRLLQSTAELTAHPACREADQLLATGEQASAALMAMTLQEMGLPAVSLTGWQAGIHTDGNHAAAEITALHRRRILRELEAGKIVIVAGFQGVDREGDITTLGRGGSDTTAVVLAAAFDACGCRICTDVDGVYDRDPREFPQSRRYERIPYDEMLEMAEGGAKVLHPRSVFLARKYRVPLKVLRTGAETPCGWNERDKPRGGESGPQGRPPQAAVGRRSRPNPPRRGGLPCGPKPALCRELAEESVGCRKPYKNVRFGAGNVSHIDGKAGPAPVTIAAVRPGPIHRWDRAPMQGGCLVYEYLGSKGSAQGLHHPLWREPGGGAAQCQF